MVFSSILFLLYFLPVFLVVYYMLPYKARNPWVLAASIFFYAWGAPDLVFIILLSLVADILRDPFNLIFLVNLPGLPPDE
jgi:alginate O-acetyltransferase complex protein AlgI